MSKIKINRFFF